MQVSMLLCDWAEEINGKLYIQGAGWTRVGTAAPISMALAVLIGVPWDQANRPHKIRASLMTDDGEVYVPEGGEGPVELDGLMEVGRPPGSRPGTPLNAPMAVRFQGLSLPVGAYSWHLEIDGDEVAAIPFEVIEGTVT